MSTSHRSAKAYEESPFDRERCSDLVQCRYPIPIAVPLHRGSEPVPYQTCRTPSKYRSSSSEAMQDFDSQEAASECLDRLKFVVEQALAQCLLAREEL